MYTLRIYFLISNFVFSETPDIYAFHRKESFVKTFCAEVQLPRLI